MVDKPAGSRAASHPEKSRKDEVTKMNPFRMFVLLTLGFSHQAYSAIKGWSELDNCKMLIHVACGSGGYLNDKEIAGVSKSFKEVLMEGGSGFTDVTLANIDHPIPNYRCDKINEDAPYGMILYLTSHDKKTCIGLFTRDGKTKSLKPLPLAETLSEVKEFDYGFSTWGPYLCSPITGSALVNAIGGKYGNPLIRCAVNDKMPEEKKAKQAVGATSGTAPTTQAPPIAAPLSKNSAFETAKLKCKQLGNKEGSNKFNKCVMTLME